MLQFIIWNIFHESFMKYFNIKIFLNVQKLSKFNIFWIVQILVYIYWFLNYSFQVIFYFIYRFFRYYLCWNNIIHNPNGYCPFSDFIFNLSLCFWIGFPIKSLKRNRDIIQFLLYIIFIIFIKVFVSLNLIYISYRLNKLYTKYLFSNKYRELSFENELVFVYLESCFSITSCFFEFIVAKNIFQLIKTIYKLKPHF